MLGFGDLDALQAEYNNFTSIFFELDSEKQTKFISSRSLKKNTNLTRKLNIAQLRKDTTP